MCVRVEEYSDNLIEWNIKVENKRKNRTKMNKKWARRVENGMLWGLRKNCVKKRKPACSKYFSSIPGPAMLRNGAEYGMINCIFIKSGGLAIYGYEAAHC